MTIRLCLLAALAQLAVLGQAHAVIIDAKLASTVSSAPFALGNFGDAGTNGFVSNAGLSIAGGMIGFASGGAGVYDGNVSGVVTSPTATGNYLAAQTGSAITFSFTAPQTRFQLLWGSVDNYNNLTFTRTDGTSLTVNGGDVQRITGSTGAAYVTISDVGSFRSVVASTAAPAFEFNPSVQVPEPGSLALIAAGLGGLAWARRRRG